MAMAEDETWRRSTFCADSACVEVANFGDHVAVRDAKKLTQTPIRFEPEAWNTFLNQIIGGKFKHL